MPSRPSSSEWPARVTTSDENDSIGSAGDRNAFERVRVTDDLFARAVHGANARASGQNEGAVDVKEDEFAHRVYEPIYNRRSGG